MGTSLYTTRVQSTDESFSTYWAATAAFFQNGVVNGVNDPAYQITPGGGATQLSARLRLSRIGQLIRSEVSFDGGSTWAVDRTVNRAQVGSYDSGRGTPEPLGATLRVGLHSYSAFANPTDFRARFPAGVSFQSL